MFIVGVGEGWTADSGHNTSCLRKPSSETFNTDTDHHHRDNLGGGGGKGPSKDSCVLATELTVGKRGVCILK